MFPDHLAILLAGAVILSAPGTSAEPLSGPCMAAWHRSLDREEMDAGQHPQLTSPLGGCAYVAAGLDRCGDFRPRCIYLPDLARLNRSAVAP
jgi:hypothetical protein